MSAEKILQAMEKDVELSMSEYLKWYCYCLRKKIPVQVMFAQGSLYFEIKDNGKVFLQG